MADIRFKISGSSEPFIAKLYCGTSLIQQKAIDYSGTCCNSCNIIGNLYPNSSYSLIVSDSIGNLICTGFTTPVQVGTTTLASKSICLAGVAYSTGLYNCYLTDSLVLNPVLSVGECLTLCFASKTIGGSTTGVGSNVSISCCQNGCSTWNVLSTASNAGCCIIPSITLCCGDKLCYSLSTIRTAPLKLDMDLCGCAELKLVSAVPTGFLPIVLNTCVTTSISYTTTTTTSTTTLLPQSVFIGSFKKQNLDNIDTCVCAKICVTPPLSPGQSFRLCYTTAARSFSASPLPGNISAMATIICSFSNLNCAYSCVSADITADCNGGGYSYIDVNSTNIDKFTLCLIVKNTQRNESYDSFSHSNCSNIVFNAISSVQGGNFILWENQCLFAQSYFAFCEYIPTI